MKFKSLKKLREDAKNLVYASIILASIIGYQAFNGYLNDFIMKNSPKIKSLSELERLIENSKKEKGFDREIEVVIDSTDKNLTAESIRLGDGSYQIRFSKDYLKLKVLDHELYHIFEGHIPDHKPDYLFESIWLALKNKFYNEPKTTMHTLLN